MKNYFILTLGVMLFWALPSYSFAATSDEMQTQIEMLQSQIKKLKSKDVQSAVPVVTGTNPRITEFDDAKDGKPKIVLISPTKKNTKFSKVKDNDPIVIEWTAYNVPEETNLTIDLHNVKIKGPIGGGSYQFQLPEGDSKGIYKLDIYGEGRASEGSYRIQLGLEECSSLGCTSNAHFPGQEEDVSLYAQSRSVGVKIIGKSPAVPLTKEASISTIDDTDTKNPTVTGVTKPGVTSVGFSIGQGDLIYGSGPVIVNNNRWSHTITENLDPGRYTITLYVNNKRSDYQKFTVK